MPAAGGPAGRHGATGAAPLLALQRRPGNTAVSRLVVQRYEAWEHRQLGARSAATSAASRCPTGSP
jgi:hypothetical protein